MAENIDERRVDLFDLTEQDVRDLLGALACRAGDLRERGRIAGELRWPWSERRVADELDRNARLRDRLVTLLCEVQPRPLASRRAPVPFAGQAPTFDDEGRAA